MQCCRYFFFFLVQWLLISHTYSTVNPESYSQHLRSAVTKCRNYFNFGVVVSRASHECLYKVFCLKQCLLILSLPRRALINLAGLPPPPPNRLLFVIYMNCTFCWRGGRCARPAVSGTASPSPPLGPQTVHPSCSPPSSSSLRIEQLQ